MTDETVLELIRHIYGAVGDPSEVECVPRTICDGNLREDDGHGGV
jgi:hypothetical protein